MIATGPNGSSFRMRACRGTSASTDASCAFRFRNRAIFPDQGVWQSISAEVTVPGSDLEYYKLEYRHHWYRPLTDTFTLLIRGEVGYGAAYGKGGDELPFFDRFYAALLGAKAVELLLEGRNNSVSVLQYNGRQGFHVEGYDANRFRDRWGLIHARRMHPALYDPVQMKPSAIGIEYLTPIFTDAIGEDDMEHMRQTLFASGNLTQPYHSINTDVNKRIRYLEPVAP